MSSWYNVKKVVRAAITVMDGEKEIGTYFATDYLLGDIIDIAEGLEVYEGDFEFGPDDDYKLPMNKTSVPWLIIENDKVPTTISKSRFVSCCAYNATSDFMSKQLSSGLDHYDKNWYEMHDLVTNHGLPQRHSFTVIQQLVEPYGVGIKNITIPENSQRFDEYRPFMLALGTNPFFAVDGRTTNEEALERLFPNNEDMKNKNRERMFAQWRFECTDQPYKGAIVMKMLGSSNSAAGDHNGGSSYEGPRAPNRDPGNWIMAIKLGRLENIKYKRPIILPEYVEYAGSAKFDWWKIVDPDSGKTLREIQVETSRSKSNWNKPSVAKPLVKRGKKKDEPVVKVGDSEEMIWAYTKECKVCKGIIGSDKSYSNSTRACPHCFVALRKLKVSPKMLHEGYLPVEDPHEFLTDIHHDDHNDSYEYTGYDYERWE